jgi:hypothetical protein
MASRQPVKSAMVAVQVAFAIELTQVAWSGSA